MFIVLSRARARSFEDDGTPAGDEAVHDLPAYVARSERERPRWVWNDTRRWYPGLLAAGVRVERCVDLRLSHAIIRTSMATAASRLARAEAGEWDAPPALVEERPPRQDTLFDLEASALPTEPDVVAEWLLQREAVAAAPEPARLGLLLAAESAGALIAVEMKHGGLPFDKALHETLLERVLGSRPRGFERPAELERLKGELVRILGFEFNPDSAVELLKALRKAGLRVESTSKWEIGAIDHPVIGPLLQYKKLSRLLTANGWAWADAWVDGGRFRPEYVPGGVVTGRWAASGGGALQLPKQVRGAVVADPGWKLVVADAAQLEPRVLAALSGDRGMVAAGSGDMYEGIVASGAVATRDQAKVAMLGAMYGATTGDSARLMPSLAKAFPRAIRLVEDAARAGERGEIVSTRLGRSSPAPGPEWDAVQSEASASAAAESRARGRARSWGRFTRNFVVQGTAAEWALCWMGGLRGRLWNLADGDFVERPHLVFFLHDEVMVHTPAHLADAVAQEVAAAAEDAGRLIFGALPVRFPVTTAIVDSYADAK